MKNLILLISILFCGQTAFGECPTTDLQVEGLGKCLKIKTFKSKELSKKPILSIVIHGDSPFSKPKYHYDYAKRIAQDAKNQISVGLLRPGYIDHEDRKSDGLKGLAVGDNYDDNRVEVIAASVRKLRRRYPTKKLIAIGHSGGAAIVGKILALRPQLVDVAILVSCPCDLNAWRADMFKKTGEKLFYGDLSVSSPLDLVSKIPKNSKIKVIVGKKDLITKPYLSERYYNALKQVGVDAEFFRVPGEHNILHSDRVFGLVKETLH